MTVRVRKMKLQRQEIKGKDNETVKGKEETRI